MNSGTRNILLVALVAVVGVGLFYSHKQFIAKKGAASSVVAPKTILAFLGAPGSGKGTLAKQAVTQLHFTSLSTGDLCRVEVASGSEKGKMIAEYMKGGLIPDQVMTEMVESWLNAHAGTEPIILDGYPRTKNQAVMLADLLKTKFADYKFGVVSLNITNEEEVVQRIASRLVCENCSAVYSKKALTDATTCPACGGALGVRGDDTEEIVRERLAVFNKNNAEIIAYYTQVGTPVHTLTVSGVTPEQIFEEFNKILPAYAPKKEVSSGCSCSHCACSMAHEEPVATVDVVQELVQEPVHEHSHMVPAVK
ncbi:hypothetical protein CVU75_02955 [Candidatus Dependentiae bacterium HGW-Dependentiae-1]|nr:MAG: hypothetical protein CVU75_02955 [Candidatus Dependentiae bacterium HGW-Dependentiae-1]